MANGQFPPDDTIFFEVSSIDFVDQNHGWIKSSSFSGDWSHFIVYRTDYLLKTSDGGNNWNNLPLPGNIDHLNFINPDTGWATQNGNKLLNTMDGGHNWSVQKVFYPDCEVSAIHSIGVKCIFAIIVNPRTPHATGRIFKSLDGGNSWTDISPADSLMDFHNIFFVSPLQGIAVGSKNDCHIVLGTYDGGLSWQTLDSCFLEIDGWKNLQLIDIQKGFFLVWDRISDRLDLIMTDDSFKTHRKIAEDVIDFEVIDSLSVFILTRNSVFQMLEDGSVINETSISEGYKFVEFVDNSFGWIVRASDRKPFTIVGRNTIDGGEHWKSQEIKVDGNNTSTSDISFQQIKTYPNPAKSIVIIEAEHPGPYHLYISSPNSQLMYNREMEGTSCQLDLSSFQKGVYFITIRSKDFVTTRKIIKL